MWKDYGSWGCNFRIGDVLLSREPFGRNRVPVQVGYLLFILLEPKLINGNNGLWGVRSAFQAWPPELELFATCKKSGLSFSFQVFKIISSFEPLCTPSIHLHFSDKQWSISHAGVMKQSLIDWVLPQVHRRREPPLVCFHFPIAEDFYSCRGRSLQQQRTTANEHSVRPVTVTCVLQKNEQKQALETCFTINWTPREVSTLR